MESVSNRALLESNLFSVRIESPTLFKSRLNRIYGSAAKILKYGKVLPNKVALELEP